MKGLGWMLAIALAATGVAAAPVAAQPDRVRMVEKRTYYESDRKWRGGNRKWRGSDRKWDNSRAKWRTNCRTQWRYGHRERVCRRVRYRSW